MVSDTSTPDRELAWIKLGAIEAIQLDGPLIVIPLQVPAPDDGAVWVQAEAVLVDIGEPVGRLTITRDYEVISEAVQAWTGDVTEAAVLTGTRVECQPGELLTFGLRIDGGYRKSDDTPVMLCVRPVKPTPAG